MKLKIDTKSIKFKSWLYFILFAAVLMAALWIVQVLLLNNLYRTSLASSELSLQVSNLLILS